MRQSVYTFYQLLAEEKEFVDYVESTGQILAWTDTGAEHPEDLSSKTLRELLADPYLVSILFAPAAFAGEISPERRVINGRTVWDIPSRDSCLLSYRRWTRGEDRLCETTLVAVWNLYGSKGELLGEKPQEFIHWGQRVFRWVRKFSKERILIRGNPNPATEGVASAIADRTLSVNWI